MLQWCGSCSLVSAVCFSWRPDPEETRKKVEVACVYKKVLGQCAYRVPPAKFCHQESIMSPPIRTCQQVNSTGQKELLECLWNRLQNRRLAGDQPGNRFVSFMHADTWSGCLVELDLKFHGSSLSMFLLGRVSHGPFHGWVSHGMHNSSPLDISWWLVCRTYSYECMMLSISW